MGIEPTSLAWEAKVIAIIRHPLVIKLSLGMEVLGFGVLRRSTSSVHGVVPLNYTRTRWNYYSILIIPV